MTTRYVHAKKGTTSGSFDTPGAPARSVGDALKVTKAGDTIEIQDAATYREDELVIDKPLTIISSYILGNPGADPTDPKFDPKLLPELTIKLGARHRVMRVAGTPATRATGGPVVVKGVRIAGGQAVHNASEPALGAGGGVAVIDIDNVTIERCVISKNSTESMPITAWPEPIRLGLKKAVLDLLLEIVTPGVEKFLNALIEAANRALKSIGYTPVPLVDRTVAFKYMDKAFDAHLSPGRPNHWLAGQAFGGGAAAVWASPTLRRCLIRDNTAEGRGAGLAVVGYGWPTLDGCWIDGNRSGSKGRLDGGAVGCEIALPGKMTRNLSEIDLVKFLTGKLSTVKTVIGSPLSHITLWDIIDYAKWLANPSQPSPPVKGLKAVILDLITGQYDPALDHLLYYCVSSALSLNCWDAWTKVEVDQAKKLSVTLADCQLSENKCADDGGGLYASVLSRVRISKTKILRNTARGSGGGIRLSMGSGGELTECELVGNTAVVDDPTKELKAGGGGLSARNVDLTLTATRIGPAAAGIGMDSNVCSDHAGGGVAFQADTEGALAGIPDLWTTIMVEVFGVRGVSVLIKAGCTITENGAGFDERRTGLSGTSKAKGGGIWLLQGKFPDAPRVEVTIEAVAATVRSNTAQTKAYSSKVQPGTVIATANEVCIQNMIGGKEWTEANFGPLLSGGDLHFLP